MTQGFLVQGWQMGEVIDHPFSVHIADQVIPCHRAAANTLQRSIKTTAPGLQSGIYFCLAVVMGRMEMYANSMIR